MPETYIVKLDYFPTGQMPQQYCHMIADEILKQSTTKEYVSEQEIRNAFVDMSRPGK